MDLRCGSSRPANGVKTLGLPNCSSCASVITASRYRSTAACRRRDESGDRSRPGCSVPTAGCHCYALWIGQEHFHCRHDGDPSHQPAWGPVRQPGGRVADVPCQVTSTRRAGAYHGDHRGDGFSFVGTRPRHVETDHALVRCASSVSPRTRNEVVRARLVRSCRLASKRILIRTCERKW